MNTLVKRLTEGTRISINNIEYIVETKTWYSIKEDDNVRYVKCELGNNKVLVIIPEDNLIYLGQVIDDMKYERISQNKIKHNGVVFNKTGDGHQYVVNIEFGNIEDVEGNCAFEDYESGGHIISLGILTDKNKRADVYADILKIEDIIIENEYNTLDYYNKNAKLYFEQTINGNLKENYDKFLSQIPKGAYILDFGCGSGRDSKYFMNKGYKVKAIDGSIEMCKLASKYIGQNAQCMVFDELNEQDTYDAIWACSSILHVEKEKLPDILAKMVRALKKNGIIYTAFKKGRKFEIKEGKYYNFLIREDLESILDDIDSQVKIIDYFETLSSTNRPDKIIWSNYILKKY
ncbi:MAG: class I SAM-dependent methyltransferase [Clostridia bacterium]|nr:class I SAM-dependent methyltransferase [Clostridia bacterium]